jgi:hypothetical protein
MRSLCTRGSRPFGASLSHMRVGRANRNECVTSACVVPCHLPGRSVVRGPCRRSSPASPPARPRQGCMPAASEPHRRFGRARIRRKLLSTRTCCGVADPKGSSLASLHTEMAATDAPSVQMEVGRVYDWVVQLTSPRSPKVSPRRHGPRGWSLRNHGQPAHMLRRDDSRGTPRRWR